MNGLRLCLGLFTILPAGNPPTEPDRATVRKAILLAPLMGMIIGLLGAVALITGRYLLSHWVMGGSVGDLTPQLAAVAAAVAVVVVEVLSGGLHMDGLADTFDGLASRADRDRTLEVMQDSAVGAMGALAISATLLINTSALALSVLRGHGTMAIVIAAIAGRVSVVWGCTQPPARPEGLGAWVSGCVGMGAAAAVTLVAMLVPLALGMLDDDARMRTTAIVVAAIPVGCVLATLATATLRRRIGGITGDVLGAMSQLATTGALLVIACSP